MCKNYSKFSQKSFKNDLMLGCWDSKNDYLESEKTFVNTLNKHAPKKNKIIWGNNNHRINETFRKAVMKRSQLKNKSNRTRDLKIL